MEVVTNPFTRQQSRHPYFIAVQSDFTNEMQTQSIDVPANNNGVTSFIVTFNMTASKDSIELWWPNGMGEQPMYDVHVGILSPEERELGMQSISQAATTWITKRIGMCYCSEVCAVAHRIHQFFSLVDCFLTFLLSQDSGLQLL
jgi:hypothetical protein